MRTDMTKGVGYDKYYDVGGGVCVPTPTFILEMIILAIPLMPAVTPDEAAASLISFVEGIKPEHAGTFWAPRGPQCVISLKRHSITYKSFAISQGHWRSRACTWKRSPDALAIAMVVCREQKAGV